MPHRRAWISALRSAVAAVLFMAHGAQAAPTPQQASALVQQTFDRSVEAVRENQAAIEERPEVAYRLIDGILAPHVDFELMSQAVLGRHWRSATPEQRQRFVSAFRGAVTRGYALMLSENVDELVAKLQAGKAVLEVGAPLPGPDERRLTVPTTLRLDGRNIPVEYRMFAREDEWKVYDVLIGGISFVINFRMEYQALLHQQSLDSLIAELEQRGAVAPRELPQVVKSR